eukprot:TRINITY_DN6589_c0_g1_i1.p1 TRINITY_DN6589_c0_g1~~TRINITY_DN6589_c0_g1_i1.p1  ORF type:complete len:334 (+),score=115.28 TRINITY_DN6589_c0_g1_i1:25-1002(+)
MSCSYNSIEVCAYSVGSSVGGYSCNYILPAGATVTCRVDQGSFYMLSSAGVSFASAYLSASARTEGAWSCPNVTYPDPNMCDCSYTNTHSDRDLVVTVTAKSVDTSYDAFHCYFYYGGANVCAWGSNNNEGNAGGCYFILPPGEQFVCAMQWGAASFSVSTALVSGGSLFTAPSRRVAGPMMGGLRAAPQEEPVDRTMTVEEHTKVFAAWKKTHGKRYSSEEEEETRFANFRKHLSAFHKKSDIKTTLPNHLADWTKAEFEGCLRGCALSQEGVTLPAAPAEYTVTEQDITNSRLRGLEDERCCYQCEGSGALWFMLELRSNWCD